MNRILEKIGTFVGFDLDPKGPDTSDGRYGDSVPRPREGHVQTESAHGAQPSAETLMSVGQLAVIAPEQVASVQQASHPNPPENKG